VSTHKYIDLICVAVLVCTVLITALFMNGSRLGIETVTDGDAEGSTDSAYFTQNDRNGSWNSLTSTQIRLSGDTASVSGSGAYVYNGNVVIAQSGHYVLTGTLNDGCVRVNAENNSKVWIMLNGVDINCSDDAAICVEQADKVFLTLAEGTENSVTSGAEYSETALADNTGGAIYTHDDLTVNGSGSLRVTAAYKHGIDANDELVITGGDISIEAPGDGIHVNEGLRIENAAVTIKAGDEGVNVQGPEALLYIASGSFNIDSTGTGLKSAYDVRIEGGTIRIKSEADGIHSAGSVTIAGGDFDISVGDDGIRADRSVNIDDGTIRIKSEADGIHSAESVTITDGDFSISSGDDGVHADKAVSIKGGKLLISECYEGVEALTIDISGGDIEIYPTDDGMNANGGGGFGGMFRRPGEAQSTEAQPAETNTEDTETWLHISGGTITVVNNVARDADGLDSNKDIVISGGTIRISLTASGSNNAIDFGSESGGSCVITGGNVVACGSSMMAEGFSDDSTQCSIFYNLGYNEPADTTVRVLDAEGNELISYTVPCTFSSVYLSAPEMKLGETYTVMIDEKETQITLDEVSTTYGESGMGGMGWGSMRQRGDNTDGGEGFRGRGNRQGTDSNGDGTNAGPFGGMGPGMGGERPAFAEGSMPPDMGQGFGGPMPPDMSFPPQGTDGEMPPSSDMNGGPGQMNGMGRGETETPAETAAPEEAEVVTGPQPVSTSTWLMIGACTLVLILGILFALKYRP